MEALLTTLTMVTNTPDGRLEVERKLNASGARAGEWGEKAGKGYETGSEDRINLRQIGVISLQ